MLERLFQLKAHNTTVRTEILAGLTTFLTMAYILFVNPSILAETGMDHGAVFVATCLAAAIGSAIMGLLANYPIALAPGLGDDWMCVRDDFFQGFRQSVIDPGVIRQVGCGDRVGKAYGMPDIDPVSRDSFLEQRAEIETVEFGYDLVIAQTCEILAHCLVETRSGQPAYGVENSAVEQ